MESSEKPIVLVIEDEQMLLEAISKKLEASGFNPVSFSSAGDALEHMRESGDIPAVIWLDYYLKDMNGIEFMKALKDNEKWAEIPVLVVSNSASDQKVSAMVAMGVKKYFLKADHRLEDIIGSIDDIVGENG